MRIESVELDDGNIPHVTRHGVGPAEILAAFDARPAIRRNKKDTTGGYYIIAYGIRVNFVYEAADRTARPISAWRI